MLLPCVICFTKFKPFHSRTVCCSPACSKERRRRVNAVYMQTYDGSKTCSKRYYAKNREKVRAAQQSKRAEDPNAARAYEKRRRAENPELYRQHGRKYRIKHRDKLAEKNRAWRLAHPAEIKSYAQKYYAENLAKARERRSMCSIRRTAALAAYRELHGKTPGDSLNIEVILKTMEAIWNENSSLQ